MFPKTSLKKGEILHPNDLMDLIRTYVTEKSLNRNGNKAAQLDDTLQMIMKQFTDGVIPINDIAQKLSTHMTKAYLITAPDGRRSLRKTQLPQIVLLVSEFWRGGNTRAMLLASLRPIQLISFIFLG